MENLIYFVFLIPICYFIIFIYCIITGASFYNVVNYLYDTTNKNNELSIYFNQNYEKSNIDKSSIKYKLQFSLFTLPKCSVEFIENGQQKKLIRKSKNLYSEFKVNNFLGISLDY
jgi:hypothetical protein